jgi:hypothetical protein
MKVATWFSLMAAAGLMAGCSSEPVNNNMTGATAPDLTMSAPFSSDAAGAENPGVPPLSDAYLPLGLTLDQLPPAAQATIRQQARDRIIFRIRRESRDGKNVYKVELKRQGWDLFHGTLIVAADGTVVKEAHISAPAATPTH